MNLPPTPNEQSAFIIAKALIGPDGLSTPDFRWLNQTDHHHATQVEAIEHAKPLSARWFVWEMKDGAYHQLSSK